MRTGTVGPGLPRPGNGCNRVGRMFGEPRRPATAGLVCKFRGNAVPGVASPVGETANGNDCAADDWVAASVAGVVAVAADVPSVNRPFVDGGVFEAAPGRTMGTLDCSVVAAVVAGAVDDR